MPEFTEFQWDASNLAQPHTEWINGNTKAVFEYKPGKTAYLVMWRQANWIPVNMLVFADDADAARQVFADYLVFRRACLTAYLAYHMKREADYGPDNNSEYNIYEARRKLNSMDKIDYVKEALVEPLRQGWVYHMDWCDKSLSI